MGTSSSSNNSNMVCQKEIISGTFNPRTYKDDDPINWAKKRKSEYLVPTGVINYTWERTKKAEDKDDKEDKGDQEEEVEIEIIRKPCDKKKKVVKKLSRDDMWPRRMRTDITEMYH